MARTFTSGTLTDGGGSAPANMANVQSALRDGVLLNAAWSLVEEFTGSSNTFHNVVLKCASGSSGLATDIFLVISRAITTGTTSIFGGEAYNAATHVLTSCAGPVGGTRGVDVDGKPTASITVDFSAGATFTNTPLTNLLLTLAASLFYAVTTDVDHCVIVGGTVGVYFGAFTSLIQGYSDPNPVILALMSDQNTAGVSSNCSATRQPVNGAATLPTQALMTDGPMAGSNSFMPGPSELPISRVDKMQNNLASAYEIPIQYQSSNSATSGRLRGKFKKLVAVSTPPTGTAVGDTFTMNGTTWMVVATTTGRSVLCDEGA